MFEVVGWLVALVVFTILEAATAGVISIWFAGGAAAALILAAVGLPLWLQVVVFFVVSVALLALLRPMAARWVGRKQEATNADRAIGQQALVTETIDQLHNTGAVKLGGIEWSARAVDSAVIPEGSLVRVVRMEGVYLYVELVEALPESLSEEKAKAAFFGK